MIAYLEGKIAEITESSVVLITSGGVGYEIFLPSHTMQHLPPREKIFALYTKHIVREDAQELFGFETWDERQTFEILISLNKVGARTGMAILSTFRPDDLRRLACGEDPLPLTRVSGIGKKTAQQIFLELKYKLKSENISLFQANTESKGVANQVYKDSLSALEGLGYEASEIASIVAGVLSNEPDLDVSGVVRSVLKNIARAK